MSDEREPEQAPSPIRGPLQGLADVNEAITAHPIHLSTFLRGLTIGALVGAAVAGLSVWRRWRRDEAEEDR